MYLLYHIGRANSIYYYVYSPIYRVYYCFYLAKQSCFWYNECDIIIRGKARGESGMSVSYKKLWKLLIDKDMLKKDLKAASGVSWASITKMSKSENVSMEVLLKICRTLNCDIGDIMEVVSDEVKAP